MKKYGIILILNFLCVYSLSSQEKIFKNAPIKKVFFVLEKQFQIKFSFSDSLVSNVEISIDLNEMLLGAILQEIQSKTSLVFQKLTKRYIIVSDKNENNKNAACGFVIDMISQKPLKSASVIIKSKQIGTNTDINGYFQLMQIEKTDSIKISFVGYKSQFISGGDLLVKPCKKINLQELMSELDEVLITNYLAKGIKIKKDGSTVINSKKLEILPGLIEPDVLQSLQLLPGINSPNETASGLHIRGGTPDQNLIIFDGIKMYNSAHLFGMISAFNPYITEKIKVFRSGAGAKYGNHISGVIDIETGNKILEKTTGGFGFNLTHADAFLKIKMNKNLSFSFSVRRSFTDVFKTNTFRKLSDKVFQNTIISNNNNQLLSSNFNDFYFTDINSKIVYSPTKKDKIIVNQLYTKNKLEHLFSLNDKSYKTRDLLEVKNNGFSSKWVRNWNDKIQQETKFYYTNYNLNYLFIGSQSIINQEQKGVKQNTITERSLQTTFNYFRNNKTTFNFGYQYSKNNVSFLLERKSLANSSNDYIFKEEEENNTHALFGEYIYRDEDKLSLQIGLRSNYYSLTEKTFLAPRIYSQILLKPQFWIKSSLEFKQQNISQLLEFSTADFGLENQIWALSTKENIPLLKSKQFTVGLIYKNNDWAIDVDFYTKKTTGLTTLSKGFETVNNNFSEGDNEINGIDVLIQKKWNNYNTWISYSLGDNSLVFSDINNGKPFAGNTDIKHNFLWSHNLKIRNYQFSLGWNYRTGIPYTNATGLTSQKEIIYQKINGSRLTPYHKLDVSATYSFSFKKENNWKGKVGLSFINIYDKKNILQRNYSVQFDEKGNQVLSKTDIFSLGFTPNIVFRVNF